MSIDTHFLLNAANLFSQNHCLPHFFRKQLRKDALLTKAAAGEKLKELAILADTYYKATWIAYRCKFNLNEIHKFSEMEVEHQLQKVPELEHLGNTGSLPNPRIINALSLACYMQNLHTNYQMQKLLKEKYTFTKDPLSYKPKHRT